MLNVQEGDSVMPKGGVYGGEVVAVNHQLGTITVQVGNSELAESGTP